MIRQAGTPMTRAARTYSLSRSTSVDARTARAMAGHRPMPIDRMITGTCIWSRIAFGRAAPAMPLMSKAVRMGGKVSCTSAIRISNAPVTPPR